MKKIVLTGGGTAGHVTPNLALVPELEKRGFQILYVGSADGMEKDIVGGAGLAYRGISSGKLRRYFSWKNLTDPFRVIRGYFQAKAILREYAPDVLFSKGGYVAAPVVWAAGRLGIPAVIHESDLTPGLANKLCFASAARVLCSFPETLPYLPAGKSQVSGCPIRRELLSGSREAGLAFTGLSGKKPVLLEMGGSLGSVSLNTFLRDILPDLLSDFDVVHLCGRGNLRPDLAREGYVQYEYADEPMKDLFTLADIVLSRAGANAICELLALEKPNLLIPLPTGASRGDQVLNARSFEKQGFSMVLEQKDVTGKTLLAALRELYETRGAYRSAMAASPQKDAAAGIAGLLDELAR